MSNFRLVSNIIQTRTGNSNNISIITGFSNSNAKFQSSVLTNTNIMGISKFTIIIGPITTNRAIYQFKGLVERISDNNISQRTVTSISHNNSILNRFININLNKINMFGNIHTRPINTSNVGFYSNFREIRTENTSEIGIVTFLSDFNYESQSKSSMCRNISSI